MFLSYYRILDRLKTPRIDLLSIEPFSFNWNNVKLSGQMWRGLDILYIIVYYFT
jgi:hypothetical protein